MAKSSSFKFNSSKKDDKLELMQYILLFIR